MTKSTAVIEQDVKSKNFYFAVSVQLMRHLGSLLGCLFAESLVLFFIWGQSYLYICWGTFSALHPGIYIEEADKAVWWL